MLSPVGGLSHNVLGHFSSLDNVVKAHLFSNS